METSSNSPEKNSNPSMSSVVAFPAKTSVSPESKLELKDLAVVFGLNMPVLLGNFDHDTCSLKTSQVSLFTTQCEEWSENWPDLGMWGSGEVFELLTSELPISESASSSWPTPLKDQVRGSTRKPGTGGKILSEEAANWPTPVANDAEKRGNFDTERSPGLAASALKWPTARAEDGESCGNHPGAVDSLTGAAKSDGPKVLARYGTVEMQTCDMRLRTQAMCWQTPATDSFRSRGGDRKNEMGLNTTPGRSEQNIYFLVGDTYHFSILGPSNAPITVTRYQNGVQTSTLNLATDADGAWIYDGVVQPTEIGFWTEEWNVGGYNTPLLQFAVDPVGGPGNVSSFFVNNTRGGNAVNHVGDSYRFDWYGPPGAWVQKQGTLNGVTLQPGSSGFFLDGSGHAAYTGLVLSSEVGIWVESWVTNGIPPGIPLQFVVVP